MLEGVAQKRRHVVTGGMLQHHPPPQAPRGPTRRAKEPRSRSSVLVQHLVECAGIAEHIDVMLDNDARLLKELTHIGR